MLIVGLILLVIGLVMAVAWRRDAGVVLAIVGGVITLVALLGGEGASLAAAGAFSRKNLGSKTAG